MLQMHWQLPSLGSLLRLLDGEKLVAIASPREALSAEVYKFSNSPTVGELLNLYSRSSMKLYRLRNDIERAFGRLKINRAIATRYDKLVSSFLGMLHLASVKF